MRQSLLNATPCLCPHAITTGNTGREPVRKFFLTFLALLPAIFALAQTFTTKAAGNWSSSATWVGGVAPGATISQGMTVNIKHAVAYDVNSNLTVSGTLAISGDTLRFASAFDKDVVVQSTGVLTVASGGFLQDVTAGKSNLQITGGKLFASKALVTISKELNASAGAKQSFKNSTVSICGKYTIDGTSASPCTDTIQSSTVQVSVTKSGDFELKNYTTLRVTNAKLAIGDGKFKTDANASISVLTGATNNYGFDVLKTSDNLENAGAWNARIDAYCVGKDVTGAAASDIDFTRPEDCSTTSTTTPAPELSFTNPVLKSGTDKKEGAVYRFGNVLSGVDAEVTLKKFSRSDIVMPSVDYTASGFAKAFQPEFGLSGYVAPGQDWYVDFEMIFYKSGTTTRTKIPRADFTAIDVDGDDGTLNEYTAFSNPAGISYSAFTTLKPALAGSLGALATCTVCNVASVLVQCLTCHGTGVAGTKACTLCSGRGVLFSGCNHAYTGILGSIIQGTTRDYSGIDTTVTAVMATFQYTDIDHINFRYGARTGLRSVFSPMRLNALWSKSFNLTAGFATLPVDFSSFSALRDNANTILNWQMEPAKALSHFVVQRSTDGKTFSDLATVAAGETTTYAYTDKTSSAVSGVLYYRIMGVGMTNETRYTDVKMVRLAGEESTSASLTVYPNPASSFVSIAWPANWQGKTVQLQLVGVNGMVVKSVPVAVAGGTQTVETSSLPKGFYLVKASCGSETAMQRIVKN